MAITKKILMFLFFLFIVTGVLFISSIKITDSTNNVISDLGVTGMKIVNFSIDGSKTDSLDFKSANYDLTTNFTKVDDKVEQFIYLKNNLGIAKDFNYSTIVEIDYNKIRWNGTEYFLNSTPLKLEKVNVYDYKGNFVKQVTPNIFMDDKVNKRINYKDMAEKGGYALAYESKGKYFIELRIDRLNIKSKENYFIDPVYSNQTDGFNVGNRGVTKIRGMDYYNNGTSERLYIIDDADNDEKIFSFFINGSNVTNAIKVADVGGVTNFNGITFNGSDFLVTDVSEDDIFRFYTPNQTGVSHVSTIGVAGLGLRSSPEGISFNPLNSSEFWIVIGEENNVTLHHFGDGTSNYRNVSGQFYPLSIFGLSDAYMTTNGTDNWHITPAVDFAYHSNDGINITDGFNVAVLSGADNPNGIAISDDGIDIWIADDTDNFVYHFRDTNSAPTKTVLNNPPDNRFSSTTNNVFSINGSDEQDATGLNITLYLNHTGSADVWSANATNTSALNDSQTNFTVALPDGAYLWSAVTTDTGGLKNFSATNRTLYVDATNPSITLNNPISIQNMSSSSVTFSATVTDTNMEYVRLYLNHTNSSDVWKINASNNTAFSGSQTNFTIALPDGRYLWSYWANDSAGNSVFATSNRTFLVDATNPSITLNNPISNQNMSSGSIEFSATITDDNIEYVRLYLNHTNSSDTWKINASNETGFSGSQFNFTTALPDGRYLWSYWANDSAGNEVFGANRTFLVDATNPVVASVNPLDIQNFSTASVTFSGTCTDDNTEYCNLYGNWSDGTSEHWHSNQSNDTIFSGSQNNFTVVLNTDAKYTYAYWVNDSAGNEVFGANRTFLVDATNPSITLNNPIENQNFTSSSVTFSATITDDNIEYVRLYLNHTNSSDTWKVNDSNNSAFTGTATNFTIDLPDEKYLWAYWANDSAGNSVFATSNRTFLVDTTSPTVTNVAPPDNSEDSDGILEISFNVTDSNPIGNCTLWLDSPAIAEQIDTSITKDVTQVFTVTNPPVKDILDWFVSCTDNFNNQANSTIWQVDTKIGEGNPGGGGGGGGAPIKLVSVVALIKPINYKPISDIDRAKIYKVINNFTEEKKNGLTQNEKQELINEMISFRIVLNLNELDIWLEQYNKDEIENVDVSKREAERWNLVTGIEVKFKEFFITPETIDTFKLLSPNVESFTQQIESNRVLKSCEVISGDVGFSCSVKLSVATIKYIIPESKPNTVSAKVSYVDVEDNGITQDISFRLISLMPIIFIGGVSWAGIFYYRNSLLVKRRLKKFRNR